MANFLGMTVMRSIIYFTDRKIGAEEEAILVSVLKATFEDTERYELRDVCTSDVRDIKLAKELIAMLGDVTFVVFDKEVTDVDAMQFMIEFIETDILFLMSVRQGERLIGYASLNLAADKIT